MIQLFNSIPWLNIGAWSLLLQGGKMFQGFLLSCLGYHGLTVRQKTKQRLKQHKTLQQRKNYERPQWSFYCKQARKQRNKQAKRKTPTNIIIQPCRQKPRKEASKTTHFDGMICNDWHLVFVIYRLMKWKFIPSGHFTRPFTRRHSSFWSKECLFHLKKQNKDSKIFKDKSILGLSW